MNQSGFHGSCHTSEKHGYLTASFSHELVASGKKSKQQVPRVPIFLNLDRRHDKAILTDDVSSQIANFFL